MKETDYTLEVLGSSIFIKIYDTGDGLSVLITGGEHPHIGAVSVKSPGEPVITHEFPTHRDSAVSDRWAEELCAHFGQRTSVSCGIHYDNITKEQISEVLLALEKLLKEITAC